MGYVVANYASRSRREAAEYALAQLEWTKGQDHNKILAFEIDGHCGRGPDDFVTYAAVEVKRGYVTRIVAVAVVQHRTEFQVGYKFVDELMGVADAWCPDRILDLLTPSENEWSDCFRAESRAWNARRRDREPRLPSLTRGRSCDPRGDLS